MIVGGGEEEEEGTEVLSVDASYLLGWRRS